MNVLICCPPWVDELSGVGSVVKYLGEHLAARGHRVVFFSSAGEGPLRLTRRWEFDAFECGMRNPMVEGHLVKSLVAGGIYLPSVLRSLFKVVRSRRIHIVNVHYLLSSFVYFGLYRRVCPGRVRLVSSIHGADLIPPPGTSLRYPQPLRLLLRTSDAVVAPSRSFLDDARARFPEINARGVVIHNGISLGQFQPEGGSTDNGRPSILCIAAHNEKKGLDTLIEAFHQVTQEEPDTSLVLVGEGPLRSGLEAIVRRYGLQERVKFLGLQARAEIARLLGDCAMLVLPSRAEPFGLVLAEAMAARRPVAATTVGGIPEVVEHEKTGLLVPPDRPDALAAAILRLLRSPDLRQRLAAAGYERVSRRFSAERMGAAYEALFDRLLSERGRRTPLMATQGDPRRSDLGDAA